MERNRCLYRECHNFITAFLAKEAIEEVAKVDQISLKDIKENTTLTDWHQSLMKGFQITGLSYQMFNQKDYDKFQKNYMRTRPEWGIADLGNLDWKIQKP